MRLLTCWLSWYDGGGTLWVAIIVTAGAGDACCIMGRLHIQTGRGNETFWIFSIYLFYMYIKREKSTERAAVASCVTAAATRCCCD